MIAEIGGRGGCCGEKEDNRERIDDLFVRFETQQGSGTELSTSSAGTPPIQALMG